MRKLAIQALPASLADARRLASRLSLPVDEIALHRFPDGELRVTVAPAACTTIIYASLDQPNDKIVEAHGILLRYFNHPYLRDFLRVTVGLPEHTAALARALSEVQQGKLLPTAQ